MVPECLALEFLVAFIDVRLWVPSVLLPRLRPPCDLVVRADVDLPANSAIKETALSLVCRGFSRSFLLSRSWCFLPLAVHEVLDRVLLVLIEAEARQHLVLLVRSDFHAGSCWSWAHDVWLRFHLHRLGRSSERRQLLIYRGVCWSTERRQRLGGSTERV